MLGFRGNPAQCKRVRYTLEPAIDLKSSNFECTFFNEQGKTLPNGTLQQECWSEEEPAYVNAGITASLSATLQKIENHLFALQHSNS